MPEFPSLRFCHPFREALAAIALLLSMVLTAWDTRSETRPRFVTMELVLAVDVSASVDAGEYGLQMQGLADAFRHPEIVQAIIQHRRGIAVSLVQWSNRAENILDPPWRLLNGQHSILSLADEIETAARRNVGHYTAIGHAIDFALQSIETNPFQGRFRKIDVSGDGQNNLGEPVRNARDRALDKGITINGLTILTDEPRLFDYYERLVVGGPAAFVMQAATYEDFANAIARKLLRELTINVSSAPFRPLTASLRRN